MPSPYPREFRNDVLAVACRGDAPLTQIAKDFGISEACLRDWLHAGDVEDGATPGVRVSESAELRETRKRVRLLEQESEALAARRTPVLAEPAGKAMYPLVREIADDGIPVTVTCGALKLARQAYHRWLAKPVTDCDLRHAHLANAMFDAHQDKGPTRQPRHERGAGRPGPARWRGPAGGTTPSATRNTAPTRELRRTA